MNDRELLELAAKAAGGTAQWRPNVAEGGHWMAVAEGNRWIEWNPLKHDDDALRLAVRLGMEIRQVHFASHAGIPDVFWQTERHGDDPYAATRRAIVRAAAAIGERQ